MHGRATPWGVEVARDSESQGAATALHRLYDSDYLALVRLAAAVLRDQDWAEDVVQDAFVQVHRSWSKIRDTGQAVFYLRRTVLNGPLDGTLQLELQQLAEHADLADWNYTRANSTGTSISLTPQPEVTAQTLDFPVNGKGMTYGSMLDVQIAGHEPDRIASIATNGSEGYIFKEDFIGYQPTSPQDAARWQET